MVLEEILIHAKNLNYLGKPPVQDHIFNAQGFIQTINELNTGLEKVKLVDLGSGGGVPALILVDYFKAWDFVLIERKEKRAEFLSWAVKKLNIEKRTEIICDEVENVARNSEYEATIDFVTARSFAPPPTTAECACRFLKKNRYLVVSEPPNSTNRWENKALKETGFIPLKTTKQKNGTFQVLELLEKPSNRLPRRPGVPRKRPLW